MPHILICNQFDVSIEQEEKFVFIQVIYEAFTISYNKIGNKQEMEVTVLYDLIVIILYYRRRSWMFK